MKLRCGRIFPLLVTALFALATDGIHAATAAFSDDGNRVYLFGHSLPTGALLVIDLTNSTASQSNSGVPASILGIAIQPHALLLVTEKSLFRFSLPSGPARKICDAPSGSTFNDVAYNPADRGILLGGHTTLRNGEDWPSYYLKAGARAPVPIFMRRVRVIVGPAFDLEGHLFFAADGDLWDGAVEMGSEDDPRIYLDASRAAPVAFLETANGTSSSTGAREVAVAGRTIYSHLTRMGGSGWGSIISVHALRPTQTQDKEHPMPDDVTDVMKVYRAALDNFKCYGLNSGGGYLCGSLDGKKVFFATHQDQNLVFYLGDENGNVHPLENLKIADPGGGR